MPIRAVIFDLGGVVLGSPLHAIAIYERELGLPANAINRVVSSTAPKGAWSRLERGEISMLEFFDGFEQDCEGAGWKISAREMMERIGETSKPRPIMLEAIRRIREQGLHVAALTNNWAPEGDVESSKNPLAALFHVFVESSVEGLRKPDPRIYELVCDRLAVRPEEAVFLDDIGANLKPARAMGMTTLKVENPESTLKELTEILGFPLTA
jgi:putative hydrolase of the HAD superfamily